MKNLKIKLLFSILIIICFFYCLTYLRTPRLAKYNLSENEFVVKITKINYREDKVVLEGIGKEKLIINYKGNIDYELGDKVKIKGSLKNPSGNTNFNLFNYKKYLLSKKIYYILDSEKIDLSEKNKNVFYKVKNMIINKLGDNVYLKAFILGDNNYIKDNIKTSYQINGISHLFAVSGMHVGFIVSLLTFILKKIKGYELLLVIMLLFYTFLTNFSPSIMRSVVFFFLCLIKNKCKWKISTFHLFLVMTMGFILYNPYYIYNIGFIYSFTISGFLIYFSDKLKANNYFQSLVKISLMSFMVSFPLTIYNNFSINLLSPILNLFFVPFVSLCVFPFSFVVAIFPTANYIYQILIKIMEFISIKCSNIEILNFIFAKPSIYILIIYYIVIILCIKNRKNFWILLALIIFHYNIHLFKFYPALTILDVGQGDSLLVELPFNRGNILIDTGGKLFDDTNYISNSLIIPYIKSLGIKKIDYLILTHGDFDHMGEATNLVENFKVGKVILNCGEFNELEERFIKVLDKKEITYYSCIKNLSIDKYKLHFLNIGTYDNENDNSNIIYTELNNYRFLFMGDAGVGVEKDLIEKYNLQNIDVLKVGHHGSKTSSNKEFIDVTNPKYSIISVGKNNRYGHPNDSVLDNLEKSKIYRTDQDGSIIFRIKKDKLKIETCLS